MRLKRVYPSGGTNDVTTETRAALVGAIQGVVIAAPIVRQQDYAVHVVHLRLGIAYARTGAARVEDIVPFTLRQGAPLVGRVAAVAYRVVIAPIRVGIAARQVIASRRAIQTRIASVRIPWAVIGVAAVPSARSQPKRSIQPL